MDAVVKPIDAAQRLRCSIATIYILARTGELASRQMIVPGRRKAQLMIEESAVVAREAEFAR